ncbi:unnamed protein product [Heligmosomoides polygyrus]|uniref:FERM domain-containing protein n=1 Tax=Heligmosomoides polygyrus TaxID=6339 RepID=A0A183FK60_HELPZ|nr:unnamed protein product [Heligmosomoides polygyrus]
MIEHFVGLVTFLFYAKDTGKPPVHDRVAYCVTECTVGQRKVFNLSPRAIQLSSIRLAHDRLVFSCADEEQVEEYAVYEGFQLTLH